MGMQYNGSQWVWADGTVMEYENWNPEEPVENELCGLMVGPGEESHGKWRSQDCSLEETYGCELYPSECIAQTPLKGKWKFTEYLFYKVLSQAFFAL